MLNKFYDYILYIFHKSQGFLLYMFSYLLFLRKDRINVRKRLKDTLFIFGSGYSINDICKSDWEEIRNIGDTMAFNMFYKSDFIDIDYYIVRELFVRKNYLSFGAIKQVFHLDKMFQKHKRFQSTYFFCLSDFFSAPSTLWFLLTKLRKRTLLFTNLFDRKVPLPISEDYKRIPHGSSTLFDCINIGYILGYKEIVLVGVDLYDSRYFYLAYDQPHQLSLYDSVDVDHPTKNTTLINMELWQKELHKKGVSLKVYNRRSLLSKFLPVYSLSED